MLTKLLLSGKELLFLPFVIVSVAFQHTWIIPVVLLAIYLLLYKRRSYIKKIKMLEQQLLTKDTLSHEIRTPLTVISFACRQMIQQECCSRNIERINKAVGKIGRILQPNDQLEDISIDSFVEEINELVAPKIDQLGIDFKIKCDINSKSIVAKVVPLQQVIINLINNSCDAIKDREEKWISLELKESDKKITISVTDSGPGIPLKLHQKIMNTYFTTKKRVGGKGLGLSICKEIINDHKGSLELNVEACHTQFIISLPKLVA